MTADEKAHLEAEARRECAPVFAVIRESYNPPEPIEAIVIAAFIHGAGWAFSVNASLEAADRRDRLAERWS
jgi:hypothetical protein